VAIGQKRKIGDIKLLARKPPFNAACEKHSHGIGRFATPYSTDPAMPATIVHLAKILHPARDLNDFQFSVPRKILLASTVCYCNEN